MDDMRKLDGMLWKGRERILPVSVSQSPSSSMGPGWSRRKASSWTSSSLTILRGKAEKKSLYMLYGVPFE